MNKRRILIIALILCLIAVGATGTAAYFSAETKAHNVITSGGVDLEIHEWANDDKTEEFPDDGVDNVVPATSVTKIVEIENTGSAGAWIRISVVKAVQLASGEAGDPDLLELDINTEDWTEQDGWYYYNNILQPGETTPALFTSVAFAPEMDNSYQEATATIDIDAQAVQSDNNGTTALEATGWPE